MADSLNGIVIGGLLGSNVGTLIVAQFNLGWWGAQVVVPPPVSSGGGSGGDPSSYYRELDEKRPKVLNTWVRIGHRTYQRSFKLSDKQANIVVKVINKTNAVQETVVKVLGLTKKERD